MPVRADPLDGSVSGRLMNKTAGGGSGSGANVILLTFSRKDQAPVGGQKTTQADADGSYTFSGLDRDPNYVYLAVARYQGVNYPADEPFQLTSEPNHQADVAIYETTTADDSIQLERLNLLLIGADQGVLQFMEMGSLVNPTDRTFVTANPRDQALARGLRFALPRGALGVEMRAGFDTQDVVADMGGVQVTSPVLPGRHEFALSFQLPYQGGSTDLTLQLPYPAAAYTLYVPERGPTVNASGLTVGGSTQMGGQSYVAYTASNLSKAAIVPVQLSGLGGTGGLSPTQLAIVSLGVALLVLGGGVLLFSLRRPAAVAQQRRPAPTGADQVEQERLQLLVRLATLDDRFAAGEIALADYAAERERGKRRLVELTLQQRRAPSAAS